MNKKYLLSILYIIGSIFVIIGVICIFLPSYTNGKILIWIGFIVGGVANIIWYKNSKKKAKPN